MTSGSARARSEFVYDLVSMHEEKLCSALLSFLADKSGVRIFGEPSADRNLRVPTVSFISDRLMSDAIVLKVDPYKIGIRYGDFYARRLIEQLGLLPRNGVVRVSMVHYNTMEEVEKLIGLIDRIL
jgi:selenocysteine lyase/cysteine desulfurase